MQGICVMITNDQWSMDLKEQVSGFLPLWRKVSWILFVKFEVMVRDDFPIGASEMF